MAQKPKDSSKRSPTGAAREIEATSPDKIVLEFGDPVLCPYCQTVIASSEAEEARGECEHLVCVHLVKFQDNGPDFSVGNGFNDWWRSQQWEDLYEDRDNDPESVAAFGHKALDPKMVRVLRVYADCPWIDRLVAQEDQGFGPSSGAIGPVLFGFRKNTGS